MLSSEFCEISKNAFLHRTPLVLASVNDEKHLVTQYVSILQRFLKETH